MLAFEYGINTGNRFLQFVDHDEEPEAFIAAQTKPDEPQKKSSTKDVKQSTKKVTSATLSTTAAKTNKENLAGKSTASVDQRRQQSATVPAVFGDNKNQQTRTDSARGARGALRRGGAPFDAANRGRSQRFNKFEGQQAPSSNNESGSFDQSGEGWSNEVGARSGRGRGGPRRVNFDGVRGRGGYEGGRGTGGRGRGGNFNNRTNEDGTQQENNRWQQNADSNFDGARPQSNQDYDQETSPQERAYDVDSSRRGGRGNFRGRPYHNNRTYPEGEGGQEDYRAHRRQFDRQPRTNLSGVKPIEKKDGEGAHNWGNPTENPEDHPISDEITETTGQGAPASKDWAQQVDEAEKQMTLDEYKKQIEAKKRAQQEKLPQFKTRTAGEGEDPKGWQQHEQVYRKKSNADDSDAEVDDEDDDDEEELESGDELEEEHLAGKKKLISIPLHFKPIEMPRGGGGSRGGARRGGNPRYQDRPNRDEQAPATSPNQDQQGSSFQQADDQASSYRGGQRGGRGEFRRSYGNATRGSRQGRSNADPNAPALDNPDDFPTLPKQ